jgi:hypothetical protein
MNEDAQEFPSETRDHVSVLEMSEFTVPVEQAAELFKAAGFPRSVDHISRWCRQGVLLATKEQTKNKLQRYIINRSSIDKKIDQLRREKQAHEEPRIFSSESPTTAYRHNDDNEYDAAMPRRHNGDMQGVTVPSSYAREQHNTQSHVSELIRIKDGEIERLKGKLEAKSEELTKAERKADEAERRAINIAIEVGRWQERAQIAETKLLELSAPKPSEPEPAAPEPEPVAVTVQPEMPANDDIKKPSFWRRIFGR